MSTETIKIIGYKQQEHEVKLGDYVADEDGRGGRVTAISFDEQLGCHVIQATPKQGPAYDLLEHRISFSAPPDPDEVLA